MVDMMHEQKGAAAKTEMPIERHDLSSVSDFVDGLVCRAATMKASDIHIDPKADRVEIKFRCQGRMVSAAHLSKSLHDELVGRIKILSRLRTDIHDRGQDGRFGMSLEAGGEKIDIRVSILPTFFGENAVLRILRQEYAMDHDYISLGMFPEQARRVSRALGSSYGMIIVAGPTGSGKTTTIYAMLKELAASGRNIMTIEDPVEYVMEGVRQIQVSEHGGFTFGGALRSVVRQDPDVVAIGEMRDPETAALAFQAAQTGHLIITSLHAEDVAGVHSRLLDLGVSPRALHSLSLVMSQRLVSQDAAVPGFQGVSRSGIFEVVVVAGKAKAALFRGDFPEKTRLDLRKAGECLLEDSRKRKALGRMTGPADNHEEHD